MSPDRPLLIVHVQHRVDTNQIHIRFIIGIQGADIAPVSLGLPVFIMERERQKRVMIR